jgi:hypothetical protein
MSHVISQVCICVGFQTQSSEVKTHLDLGLDEGLELGLLLFELNMSVK